MPNLQTYHNQEGWNNALLTLPNPHVFQSWEWGEFKSRWSWTVARLLWLEDGQPVAAAQVLHRPIPRTGRSFLYVPRGPVLDYADTRLAEKILTDLEAYARRENALFIKIDPDVPRQYGEPQPSQALEPVGAGLLNLLDRRGWRFSSEQIQFRNTIVIDLEPDLDDLLAGMKSKWRYNVRLADRRGVVVRSGTVGAIDHFFDMYAETATRDGFLIRPKAYYVDVWQQFMQTGQAEMLLATVEDEVVAGLILFVFGRSAWYLYGASTGQHRQLMPNHALQWAAIRRAKARGCTRYDMWGAPDVFEDSDGMWGVYRFKQGFGGQVVQGLGAFDFPVNRSLYWAFSVALPKLRAFRRRGW
jgi:lipid II:glycine glycyltransferase (peptidoglycan interpeptide bridge formation enzyme)